MLSKNLKKIFLLFIATLSLSSCITLGLYEDTFDIERVKSVLVSQDGEKLVFLSSKYHYIFDLPPPLREVLENASLHRQVSGKFLKRHPKASDDLGYDFEVNDSGEITGDILLSVDEKAPANLQKFARAIGFEDGSEGLTLKLALKGVRYLSNGITLPTSDAIKLNNYGQDVLVRNPYNRNKAIALTPITAPADVVVAGGMVIGTIVLVPVVLTFATGFVVTCIAVDCPSPLPMMVH